MINISAEALISLNSFGEPKVVKGNEATYILLTRLLLLEKGTIQSYPDMGVGLVSKYRYAFKERYKDLQQDIQDQIAAYLPDLRGVQVDVSCEDKEFKINISIDGILYKYNFDSESATLDSIKSL